uniref:Uncharacterized protein n=1 Tax=Branchiostoma floridae TaxID=7739 RepID=C3Y8M9_BRAFL|eukprot:XP_002607456.1 hypothetical protein BRAFLDRAFT_69882 [Branchiostoma floridae]
MSEAGQREKVEEAKYQALEQATILQPMFSASRLISALAYLEEKVRVMNHPKLPKFRATQHESRGYEYHPYLGRMVLKALGPKEDEASLLFQKDGLTLQDVSDGLSQVTLAMMAMQTTPGLSLQQFLNDVGPPEDSIYLDVKLQGPRGEQEDITFRAMTDRLIDDFCDFVTTRFGNLEEGACRNIQYNIRRTEKREREGKIATIFNGPVTLSAPSARKIFAIMADNHSFTELEKHIPCLTRYQVDAAKKHTYLPPSPDVRLKVDPMKGKSKWEEEKSALLIEKSGLLAECEQLQQQLNRTQDHVNDDRTKNTNEYCRAAITKGADIIQEFLNEYSFQGKIPYIGEIGEDSLE